jgi:hypothetical protein
MQETKRQPTTPSRRSALGFSAAAIIAGLTKPAVAGAGPDPDAKLIPLCDLFTQNMRSSPIYMSRSATTMSRTRRSILFPQNGVPFLTRSNRWMGRPRWPAPGPWLVRRLPPARGTLMETWRWAAIRKGGFTYASRSSSQGVLRQPGVARPPCNSSEGSLLPRWSTLGSGRPAASGWPRHPQQLCCRYGKRRHSRREQRQRSGSGRRKRQGTGFSSEFSKRCSAPASKLIGVT